MNDTPGGSFLIKLLGLQIEKANGQSSRFAGVSAIIAIYEHISSYQRISSELYGRGS